MRSMSILLLQKIQMQSSNPRIVIAVLYGQNFEIKINSTSEGRHRLRAVSAIGESFPLHCTANGKAILSALPEEKLQRLLRAPMPKLTPNTITRPAELLKEIESCRRTGIALDLEEHTEGISAIGTGFVDPMGRAIALSIPVPTTRFKRIRQELAAHLLAARDRIIEALGEPPR